PRRCERGGAMDRKLELLKQVPLFSGLGGRSLEEVGQLADEVDVPAGRVLMTEGEYGQEFFLILDGTIRIDRGGSQIATLGGGDFLGEIALLDGGPRTATATAETPARLIVLGRREFNTLIEDHREIRIAVLESLARRVRRLE